MYKILTLLVILCTLSVSHGQTTLEQTLAIMDFEVRGSVAKHLGESIADTIACHIKPVNYKIIERQNIKNVLKERLIKIDSTIDEEEREQLMKIGASYLLLGFIDKTEGLYYGGYRVVKVDDALREDRLNAYIKAARDFKDFADKLCKSLERDRQKALLEKNIITAAGNLVKQIGPWLKQGKPKSGKYKIGIFAFGDKNGKATAALGNLPVLIQGELTDQLRSYLGKEAPGKYTLLDSEQLELIFSMCSASPLGINPKTLSMAPKILKKVKLDIGIVGSYQTEDPQNVLSEGIMLDAKSIFSMSRQVLNSRVKVGIKDVKNNAGTGEAKPSGRFQVKFFYKPDDSVADSAANAWRSLTLYRVKNPESRYYNMNYLVLKRDLEGKRYKIRVINKGKPAIEKDNPLDGDRLFAASVLIDGVNSFYQSKGKGKRGPVVLHPLKTSKWVLTSPQRRMVPSGEGMVRRLGKSGSTTKIQGGKLINVKGAGHSVVNIEGFQKNKNFADAFVFARPGESIAETVGITDSVGMIAVHFYGEKLPEDKRAGTKAGKEVKSPTFAVRFKIDREPVEVLRIFYRYEDELPCAKGDLEEVK